MPNTDSNHSGAQPALLSTKRKGLRRFFALKRDSQLGTRITQANDRATMTTPRLLVYSRLFPNTEQPNMGLFVRVRMFQVAQHLPLVVVAPIAWFPFQTLLARFRPGLRANPPHYEEQSGIPIFHPRFLSFPGILKFLDGPLLALGSLLTLLRLRKKFDFDILDAHFVYPDGVAVWLLSKILVRPYTITLRGTLERISHTRVRRRMSLHAMRNASRVFSVADSLRQTAIRMGVDSDHVRVVANGVDTTTFYAEDRLAARRRLSLPETARLLISVGGLTERKGFHRIIELLPDLLQHHPDLHFLVAGGENPEGQWRWRLESQIKELKLETRVHLLGMVPPKELRWVYSAGDIFVLATRFEGWANVFLEAAACGLPIVTTDVGGNREVVPTEAIGYIVPFGDSIALCTALDRALNREWDRQAIMDYAQANAWDGRIQLLLQEFRSIYISSR